VGLHPETLVARVDSLRASDARAGALPDHRPGEQGSAEPFVGAHVSLGLPPAGACATRRRFRLSLRAPDHSRIVVVAVYLNGRRVICRHGHSIHSVLLRNLPARAFKVTVVVITNKHRQLTQTCRYQRCGAKPPPKRRRGRRHK